MEIDAERELKITPTRQLLQLLNMARACGGTFDPTEYGGYLITVKQIKNELATRKHIPNKKEAQIIRQRKAKYKTS